MANIEPTRLVEIAGADHQNVDQPRGERAEFLGAQSNPAVNCGAACSCQLPGNATGGFWGDPCGGGNPFRAPRTTCVGNDVNAVDEIGDSSQINQIFGEQDMQD